MTRRIRIVPQRVRSWACGGTGHPCAAIGVGGRRTTGPAPRRWRVPSRDGELVEVVAQHPRTRRVAQLRHGLRLDLPDALAGHPLDPADLPQRLRLAV